MIAIADQVADTTMNLIGKLLNQSVHVYFDVEWDENSQDFWLFEKLGEDWLMSLAERSTLNTAIGKLSTVAVTMLKTLIQLVNISLTLDILIMHGDRISGDST